MNRGPKYHTAPQGWGLHAGNWSKINSHNIYIFITHTTHTHTHTHTHTPHTHTPHTPHTHTHHTHTPDTLTHTPHTYTHTPKHIYCYTRSDSKVMRLIFFWLYWQYCSPLTQPTIDLHLSSIPTCSGMALQSLIVE